ncbi:CRTAC1 family protein [Porticoccus sp. W117]|uniref:CRTAC1 family protein n=1 Tax=Porticoccus sp. W117 TaxID=3054777 RepID=UPI00259A9C27|nr:CRTAC1 family protein [Porticoccus sp. W117]MDM3870341.1 CRTAC1 family protein [Porticoccus sp. W117]
MRYFLYVVGVLVFLLQACGGGGGGDGGSNSPVPPPTVVTPPTTPAPANASFTDATDSSGIAYQHGYNVPFTSGFDLAVEDFSGGVAAGDYDNDGDIDLFIVRGDIGPNRLYNNDGSGAFTDMAAAAGLDYTLPNSQNARLSGPTFADMDGDGDLDLFIGGTLGSASFVFQNNGNGIFTDVSNSAGLDALTGTNTISAAFGDYDRDGDLDMFLAHWGTPRDASDPGDTQNLWRNDSTNNTIQFVSVSEQAGISPGIIAPTTQPSMDDNFDYSFTPTFARLDDDLLPDIAVVADFNVTQYFLNIGNGSFINSTDTNVITDNNGMGSAFADYDNDGDLDWFVSAINRPSIDPDWIGNRLYQNQGDGTFTDVTDSAGVRAGDWGWGSCFMDFENDGDLDIYQTNGWARPALFLDDVTRAFVSDGNGKFDDMADDIGLDDTQNARGVVCADFDNDGDVDIFQTHRDSMNSASYYRNDSTGNNYLKVKLNGLAPNTAAAGARIYATIGQTTQMREVIIGSNFTSQNPLVQVFGLGSNSQVDELKIQWPDGVEETRNNVQAGQSLVFDHPDIP